MDEENLNNVVDDKEEDQLDTSDESESNDTGSDESTDDTKEVEDEEDEGSDLSPRQARRVEQLEKKAEELKLTKILDRIQGVKSSPRRETERPLDYKEAIDAPDEVYETLNKDRDAYGTRQREEGRNEGLEQVKSMEWRTNIKLDLPLIKDRMSSLHPDDAAAIDREYLLYSGYDAKTGLVQNPNIGYADFIEARIEQAERLAANIAVKSQKNIVKQAAQTGIRPDGGGRKAKTISSADDIANMSDAEWEKNRESYLRQIGITKK